MRPTFPAPIDSPGQAHLVRTETLRGLVMDLSSLERILEVIPNRYEAVRVMAKEARRINLLIHLAGEEMEEKPTSIAMKRLVDGKVKYTYEEPKGEK